MKINKLKAVLLTLAGVALFPLGANATNDVVLNGDVYFPVTTTDTSTERTVTALNGGTTTSIVRETGYLDITVESGSAISFQIASTVTMAFTKQSGDNTAFLVIPDCSTNTTTITATASAVLRLTLTDQPLFCKTSNKVAPSSTSITLDTGATCSSDTELDVQLKAKNAKEYVIGDDAGFVGKGWQTFSGETMNLKYVVPVGDGEKKVYVMFRSPDGNLSSSIFAKINLDTANKCSTQQSAPVSSGGGGGGGGGSSNSSSSSSSTNTTTPAPSTVTPPTTVTTPTVTQTAPVTEVEKELNIIPGDIIKGSTSTLYRYDADLKRHTFPTEGTYFTWMGDFSKVKVIDDAKLYKLKLGKNVNYQPGVRMVKLMTDPKVYAIDKGGLLRWITSEAVAKALYGTTWNKMIDDLNDSFFADYEMGDPITDASQFKVVAGPQKNVGVTTATAPSENKSTPVKCSAPNFSLFLEVGSNNSEVTELHKLLQCLGYITKDKNITSVFDNNTEVAVRSFQKAHKVQAVGYIGPSTRTVLNSKY